MICLIAGYGLSLSVGERDFCVMGQFTIDHLSEDGLLHVWPVVRMAHSHANANWWLSEATALIGRGGGILAARAPDGIIHGVATYEVAKKALLGRILAVDTLITFELSRRAPARHALSDALELLRHAFDCRSTVLPLLSKGHVQHRAKTIYGLLDFEPPESV
jgi:hypothetical protein